MDELKPCPFCGTNPQYYTERNLHWSTCIQCEAEVMRDSEEKLVEAWNTRPAENEMIEMLNEVGADLALAFASIPGIEDKVWQEILKEDVQKISDLLLKIRGKA